MKDYSKMADNYLDETGLLKQYPAKKPVREIVLQRFANLFESGRDYSEKEVNQIIRERIVFSDVELIRRELIEHGFLNRERDGSRYWKPHEKPILQGEKREEESAPPRGKP